MCPDRQILSVYFDGELPSPWKEKMEAHLRSCAACRERLEGYRRLSQVFKDDAAAGVVNFPEPRRQEAEERIWRNIIRIDRARRRTDTVKFRYRTLSLPLPAAAVLAAVFIMALLGAFFRVPLFDREQGQEMAASPEIGLDVQGIVPVSDMNGVLQYLGSQDTADFVIIRLPESKYFMDSGEPTIIKATDYTRRNGSR
ncbi:MAG: zf-HC2 domain-containing protein [Treponema sp.]|jgi:anti-sigma factor RsiW|nr:zf-HC2 domain-containing protein [Treponema sp.]